MRVMSSRPSAAAGLIRSCPMGHGLLPRIGGRLLSRLQPELQIMRAGAGLEPFVTTLEVYLMVFADWFAECMQGAGVQIDPSVVTEEGHFSEAVNYLKSWFDALPEDTREGLDDASTTADPVAAYLVTANVAGGIPDLMNAFDLAVGYPLSTLLDWCLHCIDHARQAVTASPGS